MTLVHIEQVETIQIIYYSVTMAHFLIPATERQKTDKAETSVRYIISLLLFYSVAVIKLLDKKQHCFYFHFQATVHY